MEGFDAGRRDAQKGIFTVVFAILLPVFIGALGIGIDFSRFWLVRSQLQNAADAAALAGARDLDSTGAGRSSASQTALEYALLHTADGIAIEDGEVIANETGRWDSESASFSTSNVSDAGANAIRVSVQRQDVSTFFARALSGVTSTSTLVASAIAVAGGAGESSCTSPFVIGSCALQYNAQGDLACPNNLSFKNGGQSIGLTNPDGSSPVNPNSVSPFVSGVVNSPLTCDQPTRVGDELYMQNGNGIKRASIDAINNATNDGANPIPVILPVVDMSCGNNPTYNQSAHVAGFLKMKIVGARWTGSAPAEVAQACPTLGKKNICVTSDCSVIDGAPGGGTIRPDGALVYAVQ